jgi:hypothetical protein
LLALVLRGGRHIEDETEEPIRMTGTTILFGLRFALTVSNRCTSGHRSMRSIERNVFGLIAAPKVTTLKLRSRISRQWRGDQ